MKTQQRSVRTRSDALLPAGFLAAGVSAGIKKRGVKDMALLFSESAAVAAGVFTTNRVKAAPVRWCMRRLEDRTGQAILVNSGNANACTGEQGRRDAARMAAGAGDALGIAPEQVWVCSTGRIGVPLNMPVIENGIRTLSGALSPSGGRQAAQAILTTDTRPKTVTLDLTIDGRPVRLTAMAKGAGMIEPNMATMLAFLLTDAAVTPASLQRVLREATDDSFNRITVDGDRSTNDTVLFLANGRAGNRPLTPAHKQWPLFKEAVRAATLDLALKIVGDGEGAKKVVTVRVTDARSAAEADRVARAVANSLLVKTSWVKDDANWGRVMDAIGYSGAPIAEERIDIDYDDLPAVRKGLAAGTPEHRLRRVVARKAFTLTIRLRRGRASAVVYGCDCTEAYVRINVE